MNLRLILLVIAAGLMGLSAVVKSQKVDLFKLGWAVAVAALAVG